MEILLIRAHALHEIFFVQILKHLPLVSRLDRSSKPEKNDELQNVERQVEKYRDVLQIISKKVSPANSAAGHDQAAREKRLKKIHEYLLGQALEDSAKELPDGNSFLFKKILDYCGKREAHKRPPITSNE